MKRRKIKRRPWKRRRKHYYKNPENLNYFRVHNISDIFTQSDFCQLSKEEIDRRHLVNILGHSAAKRFIIEQKMLEFLIEN